jgi:hypothetical protein
MAGSYLLPGALTALVVAFDCSGAVETSGALWPGES